MKSLILCLAMCGVAVQATADSVVVGYTNAVAVKNLSDDVIARAAQFRWFFAHASVGDNIMTGLEDLRWGNPERYGIARNRVLEVPPASTMPGQIYDFMRGNPNWQAKVDYFSSYLSNGWCYPLVDIVLNKFCWIDPDTDLSYYINSMSTLEQTNPHTWFVYATIPLTPYDESANYSRSLFNSGLRAWVRANNRILYDIADIEAHDTNGVEQTFLYNDVVCQKQFAGYTTDGGHLDTTEARQNAALGLYAVAVGLLTVDRDGDGIPDHFEMTNSLNPLAADDASADFDGDGATNLAEYQSGTDLYNRSSVLKLRVNSQVDGFCMMEFAAAANIAYTVQYSSQVGSTDWRTLANVTSAPIDRTVVLIDSGNPTPAARFYRIIPKRTL